VVQEPPVASVSAGSAGDSSPSPGEAAALAAGAILALSAVGFAVRTNRRPPVTP
jgi:hypothetical protein